MSRLALIVLTVGNFAAAQASQPLLEKKNPGNGEPETRVLPGAWLVLRADHEREQAMMQREAEAFISKVKRDYLFLFRRQRDQKVARAIAAAAVSRSFPRPAFQNISLADRGAGFENPQQETSPVEPGKTSPGFVGRAIQRTAEAARDLLSQAGEAAESVEQEASRHQSPGGYYALALIALFLVPSMGLASIVFGIAHLRQANFLPGSVWIPVGAGMLWLAASGAKMLVLPLPAARAFSAPSAPSHSP